MKFTHLKLENWRNFLAVDVPLRRRMFLVGANAAGKSNFLDTFRFLRDLADPQGGLVRAVQSRQGVSQIRSLHARRHSNVVIEVAVELSETSTWTYHLAFSQNNQRLPVIHREVVRHGDSVLLDRPDAADRKDDSRLRQTHLEQVHANQAFRVLQEAFARIQYLHLVPQLVRDSSRSPGISRDPYGAGFLEEVARTPLRTRESRMRRINEALRAAVPQLKEVRIDRDERGAPHLKGFYQHWRPSTVCQTEEQFSDGTLRLLGLLWVLLDGTAPLLLEEPEMSLHPAVVRYIPSMMARLARPSGRQILVSTHSHDLLLDEGIAREEILMLQPSPDGTRVVPASRDEQVRVLMESGEPAAEAVLPRVAPLEPEPLALFGD